MNSEENLWEVSRALWMKYCGVADEYKMLRDRWMFMQDHISLQPLSRDLKNSTFLALDKHVKALDDEFNSKLGFTRDKIESKSLAHDFLENISLFDYSTIKDEFFKLSAYVGLLKLAFSQRSVSSEISHAVSGIPHSPERTIGNELFYLAADNVAQSYFRCIKSRYAKWDGFITFAPPITDAHFYGGFMRPSPTLGLYHISLSEEQKYFVGSYLELAHEFGHAAVASNETLTDRKFQYIRSSTIKHSQKTWTKRMRRCDECIYNPNILYYLQMERHPFDEFFSDMIGVIIGGYNVIHAVLDEMFYLVDSAEVFSNDHSKEAKIQIDLPPSPESILRIYGASDYLKRLFGIEYSDVVEDRLEDLLKRSDDFIKEWIELNKKEVSKTDYRFKGVSGIKNRKKCLECLKKISESWSSFLLKWDSVWRPIYIHKMFLISPRKERKIIESLYRGIPCPQEDPRHILHCYYEAYRQSEGETRPNYAATIHSLAFNEFNKNKRRK